MGLNAFPKPRQEAVNPKPYATHLHGPVGSWWPASTSFVSEVWAEDPMQVVKFGCFFGVWGLRFRALSPKACNWNTGLFLQFKGALDDQFTYSRGPGQVIQAAGCQFESSTWPRTIVQNRYPSHKDGRH